MKMTHMKIGDNAPAFNLLGTDNVLHSLDEFTKKNILIIIFSCNHCPTVIAYEQRMINIQKDYLNKSVSMIAINSNDEKTYPEDSIDKMVERYKNQGYNFTYLRDQDQSIAKAYGATHTPEIFIFDQDRNLRYHGRIDDNRDEPNKVNKKYVRDALDALINNKPISIETTHSIGCTIKWSD